MGEHECLLGVDIGGTKCAVCVGTEKGDVLNKKTFPTNESDGPEQALDNIVETALNLTVESGISVKSIGVSCGSPLNSASMIIQSPPHLRSWRDVKIGEILKTEFGDIPMALENDANAGALAEHRFGAGRGTSDMLFMTFGTGLGAGLILNGTLYRGACGLAGELGHMRLADSGPGAPRKAGSFEGFCSGNGIAQLAEKLRANFAGETILSKKPSAKDVGLAALANDELALKVLETSGERLGQGLSMVIDMLNPELIVIGSVFKRCERFLRPPMERVLECECMAETLASCRIVSAELGESIGDQAALAVAALALEKQ
jgi:glucokinase